MNDKISDADADVQTLTAIRGRLALATPGPWQARFLYRLWLSARQRSDLAFNGPDTQDWPDADFCANAIEDIPYLLRLLAQLQGERDVAVALNETIDSMVLERMNAVGAIEKKMLTERVRAEAAERELTEANMNYAGRDLEAASYLARAESAERERDEARADAAEAQKELIFYRDTSAAHQQRAEVAESRLLASTGSQEGQTRAYLVTYLTNGEACERAFWQEWEAQAFTDDCNANQTGRGATNATLIPLVPAPRHEETSRTTTTEDALTRIGELGVQPSPQHASTNQKASSDD